MLAEPVSKLSKQPVAGVARYLMRQVLLPPLSTVLSVTMTQTPSTLASLLQGVWHPDHTPASQSALCPLLTDVMFPLDLLQQLVSFLAQDTPAFLTVFCPLLPILILFSFEFIRKFSGEEIVKGARTDLLTYLLSYLWYCNLIEY